MTIDPCNNSTFKNILHFALSTIIKGNIKLSHILKSQCMLDLIKSTVTEDTRLWIGAVSRNANPEKCQMF